MKKLKRSLFAVLILSFFAYVYPNNVFAAKIRRCRSCPRFVLKHCKSSSSTVSHRYSCTCLTMLKGKINDEVNNHPIRTDFNNNNQPKTLHRSHSYNHISFSGNLDITLPFSNSQDSITFDPSEKIISIPTGYLPINELSDEGKQYFEELEQQTQQFLQNKHNIQSASVPTISFLNNFSNIGCNHNKSFASKVRNKNLGSNLDSNE